MIKYSRIVALPLILLAPLLGFILYHNYSLVSIEAMVLALVSIALGLIGGGVAYSQPHRRILISIFYALAIVFAVDIQVDLMNMFASSISVYGFVAGVLAVGFLLNYFIGANFSGILACAFSAYILSLLIIPNTSSDQMMSEVLKEVPLNSAKSPNPLILHLMFDGHIGIEGIPAEISGGTELKYDLKIFFSNKGFKLFGGAYSRYDSTGETLADMYSYSGKAGRYEYFKKISTRGMDIKYFGVQKPSVNYCTDNKYVSLCRVKNFLSVGWIQNQGLSFRERITILTKAYLHTSDIYIKLNVELFKIRNRIDPKGQWWPEFSWEENILAPTITAFSTAEDLKSELRKASLGDAYFAHFILPHAPYMYNQKCELKDLKDWIGVLSITGSNTAEMRRARYLKYFDQVKCAQTVMDDIFNVLKARGLYEKSVIVVHGDHGSRINVGPPFAKTKTDFLDRYSTLLAIKLPEINQEYDPRPIAVPNALQDLNMSEFKIFPSVDKDSGHQKIFVRGKPVEFNFLGL